jgi:aldose 1-epimerase
MAYQIRTETRPNTLGLDDAIWIVEDGQGSGMEIWPALGFNCFRWFVQQNAATREILYTDPAMFEKNQTTRMGIPVLFPFPNRIRAGRFNWEGRTFQLPCIDSTRKNAIHGFACRVPWRVIDQGVSQDDAWVTGEYHAAKDFSHLKDFGSLESCWPADHRVRLTHRLGKNRLRIEIHVDNPDNKSLPFGLGFHPYFRADCVGDGCLMQVPAEAIWELQESLPTGKRGPAQGRLDLRSGKPIAGLKLDDVLTGLPTVATDGLAPRGSLRSSTSDRSLTIRTSTDFREIVVFTPPHGQAVCIEPYTCTTDAVNLQQEQIDAGWKVLQPGQSWTGVVELVVAGEIA